MSLPTDERPTSVRLPAAVEERVRNIAVRERRSLSAQIVVLLEKALAPDGTQARVVADSQPRDVVARTLEERGDPGVGVAARSRPPTDPPRSSSVRPDFKPDKKGKR